MPVQKTANKRKDTAFSSLDSPQPAYEHIVLSLVEFDPAKGEEIFLCYTPDMIHGPGIRRSGDRSPSMWGLPDIDEPFAETTDPDKQRMGTWFIDQDCANREIRLFTEKTAALSEAQKNNDTATIELHEEKLKVLNNTARLATSGCIHEEEFKRLYPDYEIIGHQGCGDLTMNLWYVAFVCSKKSKGKPKLIWLYNEPIHTDRTYTCLVKYTDKRVVIENDIKFKPKIEDSGHVHLGKECIDESVEFAVFGKQLIREGTMVNLSTVVHQFADIRHLLNLPNLNPNSDLYSGDPAPKDPVTGRRIRYYYGQEWRNDVWMSEKQLLEDWNLQRAALVGPVIVDRLYGGMGPSKEQIEGAMKRAGYQQVKDSRSLQVGEWQFVPWDSNLIEVYFKPSRYPWSMIGVDERLTRIFFFACNGHQGRTGFTLQEAVNIFIKETEASGNKVWNALLMDEGNDVFQKAKLNGVLETTVPLRRGQVRASFLVAQKKPEGNGKEVADDTDR